jgi:CheY-like chemotaxis protein
VLIVDDDVKVAQALARMLRDHDTTLAGSGTEAIELLRSRDFELVLCDLMMPGVSGVDVYESIAQSKPDVAARIVFVSGGAFTDRGQSFLERVPNARLDKPFTVAEVRRVAREAAEYWAAAHERAGS